ncbi:MAG: phosphoribosylamine--glycine ligase [Gammaproteobacteria bacterium]
MRVLIVGGGGREHALAWKVAASPEVEQVLVAPGNAGTAREPKVRNVAVAVEDTDGLLKLARRESIGLAIIGPEVPLVAGIVDTFQAAGLRCLGPSRAAARLEGSKAYAKAFFLRHRIPSAAYAAFSEPAEAHDYIDSQRPPIVIKADGLAAGKGVVIAEDPAEAHAAATAMLGGTAFGEAGRRIVIEEFLHGEEATFTVLCDGAQALPLATAQDHKRRDDGDRGPNTGGMGAYSPAPVITPDLQARIMDEVIAPILRGMAQEGCRYRGFLYAGLMLGPDGGPRVLEINCRLGDPEAEVILMRLRSDLVELSLAALDGRLHTARIDWDPRPAAGVVLAAAGYPANYRKGDTITGLVGPATADTRLFHAGTAESGGQVITAGGRVLCVCALGETVQAALDSAYRRIETIHWPGMHYRRDIGHRALRRERGIHC